VLATVAEPARPVSRMRLLQASALAAALLLFASAVGSYFAPRFAQALADAPGLGTFSGPMLRGSGLAAAHLTSLNDVARSSGYTIHLAGGYADATRTLLLIHVDSPSGVYPLAGGSSTTLADQVGRSYHLTGAVATPGVGGMDEILMFEPIGLPASVLGARLNLHITTIRIFSDRPAVAPPNTVAGRDLLDLPGRWDLHGTLVVEKARALPLPADGRMGDSTFHFTEVRATPASIAVRIQVSEPLASQVNKEVGETIPGVAKPHPALVIRLLDPSGAELQRSYGARLGSGSGPAEVELLAARATSGPYRLVVSYEGIGTFERTIDVP
jgi:hypothetical protein